MPAGVRNMDGITTLTVPLDTLIFCYRCFVWSGCLRKTVFHFVLSPHYLDSFQESCTLAMPVKHLVKKSHPHPLTRYMSWCYGSVAYKTFPKTLSGESKQKTKHIMLNDTSWFHWRETLYVVIITNLVFLLFEMLSKLLNKILKLMQSFSYFGNKRALQALSDLCKAS